MSVKGESRAVRGKMLHVKGRTAEVQFLITRLMTNTRAYNYVKWKNKTHSYVIKICEACEDDVALPRSTRRTRWCGKILMIIRIVKYEINGSGKVLCNNIRRYEFKN